MAAINNDSKTRDDSSAEARIPTGEKIEIQHVEKLDTTDATAGVKASQVYENMAPIVELGLPDWRATERQLVRRLDMSLMPTSEYPASVYGRSIEMVSLLTMDTLVWLLYFNNYLDRTNIAQARLAPTTIDESLGLSGEDYNIAVSVLTAGESMRLTSISKACR